jgi:hypothetical protein
MGKTGEEGGAGVGAPAETIERPLTYQEAKKRYRVDHPAIVVESAEGASFVPRDNDDAWSDERQAGVDALLRKTRERLAEQE